MVEAGPQGAARAVEHAYEYLVSEEFIEERVELEGVELPRRWAISFSLRDLPDPGTRTRALNLRKLYQELDGELELEAPTDDPIEFLDRLEEWVGAERDLIDYEESQQRHAEASRELEVQAFEQGMDAWIEKHGSRRLKTARKKRYKVTSSYARARGREELPGFWIDTAGVAQYRERVDPSAEALEAEASVEGFLSQKGLELRTRVVWLVDPPSGLAEAYEDWEFEQQEAVFISNYLGRYEAFMPIDVNDVAPTAVKEEDR